MAMTKAEMEHHRSQYQTLMAEAESAEQQGSYREAVAKAVSCFEHINGMMQYERKYNERGFRNVGAIEVVLKYAPLLLDSEALNKAECLLKECRSIEKNTLENLGGGLAAAKTQMWQAYRLWDYLERKPHSPQAELRVWLGGQQKQWDAIVEGWQKLGLVQREADGPTCRLALSTLMSEVVRAKCPACGHLVEATKFLCLDLAACPMCQKMVLFVILAPAPPTHPKE